MASFYDVFNICNKPMHRFKFENSEPEHKGVSQKMNE